MPTQTPLKILQDARDHVLADSPFNISAYRVLCSAIGHVIGMRDLRQRVIGMREQANRFDEGTV